MKKWNPINFHGSWHYDPREEIRHRARIASDQGDSYVSIPIELAMACADLHECDAMTITTGDEDGPLPEPLTIYCRLPRDHHLTGQIQHYNGYTHWE